jgi:DNA-binding IclR family transcriptional regulator
VAATATPVEGAQSIARAMRVLRLVARTPQEGAGLLALTRDTGLNKPTVHRLLSALVAEGMLEQDPDTRRYFLGSECHVLGNIAAGRHGHGRMAADIVAMLARQCRDTAFFSIRRGVFAVCVLREDGDYPIKTHALLAGDRHPLGIGAGSLAMLAALPDDEIDRCIQANAALMQERYAAFPAAGLWDQVREARRQGYASNRGLIVPGSWGVGVAVRGDGGEVIAALSIAAIESRMDEDRQRQLGTLLAQAASKLEFLIVRSATLKSK